MCRQAAGTSGLDHVQFTWGGSKVKGFCGSLTAGKQVRLLSKQRTVAASDMRGRELAQSHWEAPLWRQLKQKHAGISF